MRRAAQMWLWVFLVATLLGGTLAGCSDGAAARPPILSDSGALPIARPEQASLAPSGSGSANTAGAKAFPLLGAEVREETNRIKNGQRLSLGDDRFVEVLVVPFPPSPETDLHLFLKRGSAPVKDAQVKVTYDMIDMDHGAKDKKLGREIEDGHYAVALDMFMWGDWVAEVVVGHPQFDANFSVLLGVRPR